MRKNRPTKQYLRGKKSYENAMQHWNGKFPPFKRLTVRDQKFWASETKPSQFNLDVEEKSPKQRIEELENALYVADQRLHLICGTFMNLAHDGKDEDVWKSISEMGPDMKIVSTALKDFYKRNNYFLFECHNKAAS